MTRQISGAFQGANHEESPLIRPFYLKKGMLQMDSLNYVIVECKDCVPSTSFIVGCIKRKLEATLRRITKWQ